MTCFQLFSSFISFTITDKLPSSYSLDKVEFHPFVASNKPTPWSNALVPVAWHGLHVSMLGRWSRPVSNGWRIRKVSFASQSGEGHPPPNSRPMKLMKLPAKLRHKYAWDVAGTWFQGGRQEKQYFLGTLMKGMRGDLKGLGDVWGCGIPIQIIYCFINQRF